MFKKIGYFLLFDALFFLCYISFQSFTVAPTESEPTAKEIVQKADQKMRGVNSSQGTLKMTIVRPNWTREMTLKTWSKGQEYAMVLVLAPAREKGMAFLKLKDQMWSWQPKIEKAIKLPASMMAQNWMGSDFSNDDLVKQASLVDDYTHKRIGEGTVEGRACYKVELTPKEDAAVVWGKLLLWVSKKDFLQLKAEFYDEDDYLVHTILGKNIKTMGGRTLTTLMEVIPAEEEANKTTIEYLDLQFDQAIADDFFSIKNMKKLN